MYVSQLVSKFVFYKHFLLILTQKWLCFISIITIIFDFFVCFVMGFIQFFKVSFYEFFIGLSLKGLLTSNYNFHNVLKHLYMT